MNRIFLLIYLISGASFIYGNSGQVLFYIKDHLGSTRMTIDRDISDVSRIKETRSYYPFGKEMPGKTDVVENRTTSERYTGKELDAETELSYFGARYYNAEIGRWVSVDPINEYHTPFGYVRNNPISSVDMLGLDTYKIIRGEQGESDTKAHTEAAIKYIMNLEDFDKEHDDINILDVQNVPQFKDAMENHNDFGPMAGVIFLGHSGIPEGATMAELYVNLTAGTPNVDKGDIMNMKLNWGKKGFMELYSCKSASLAGFIHRFWAIPTLGNLKTTDRYNKNGFLVGDPVKFPK